MTRQEHAARCGQSIRLVTGAGMGFRADSGLTCHRKQCAKHLFPQEKEVLNCINFPYSSSESAVAGEARRRPPGRHFPFWLPRSARDTAPCGRPRPNLPTVYTKRLLSFAKNPAGDQDFHLPKHTGSRKTALLLPEHGRGTKAFRNQRPARMRAGINGPASQAVAPEPCARGR